MGTTFFNVILGPLAISHMAKGPSITYPVSISNIWIPREEGVCGMDWEIGVEKQTIMYKIDNQ